MALARYAIINGKKVLLDSPAPKSQSDGRTLDKFSSSMLSQFGFLRIAQKVERADELTQEDIELLLSKAGMPVLMKLVSLQPKIREISVVRPAVILPISLWSSLGATYEEIAEESMNLLKGIPYDEVQVAIDEIDHSKLSFGLGALFIKLSQCREGITLVGPSVESLQNSEPGRLASRAHRLGQKLLELRGYGFKRLRASSDEESLQICHELGFSTSLVTYADDYPVLRYLAQELIKINSLAKQSGVLEVWSPGLRYLSNNDWVHRKILDYQLLRILAVSSLCLTNVPFIRASSRNFSLATLHLAPYFGANDLGFGAFDSITEQQLQLQPMKKLERVVRFT
ncbi:MAG: hypothetical protein H6619_06000 [Deltaproteobacteria bacterium]|nr:hypothetical protein [Deltaproteobacteria bacterium]